jgi:ribosomal protein S20
LWVNQSRRADILIFLRGVGLASDEGDQAKAEKALKSVESALDQLKAQDPEAAFKNMH